MLNPLLLRTGVSRKWIRDGVVSLSVGEEQELKRKHHVWIPFILCKENQIPKVFGKVFACRKTICFWFQTSETDLWSKAGRTAMSNYAFENRGKVVFAPQDENELSCEVSLVCRAIQAQTYFLVSFLTVVKLWINIFFQHGLFFSHLKPFLIYFPKGQKITGGAQEIN